MKPQNLKSLNLEEHLACSKLVDCKKSSLILLDIFLRNNPNFGISSLVSNEKSQRLFLQWQNFNVINSVKAETIPQANLPAAKPDSQAYSRVFEGSLCMKGVLSSNKIFVCSDEEELEEIHEFEESADQGSRDEQVEHLPKPGAVLDSHEAPTPSTPR